MSGLYLPLPTFLVILLSLLVVWAGGIALDMTGMDEKKQDFRHYQHLQGLALLPRKPSLLPETPAGGRLSPGL
jgi:hypothetical protein